jgi:tetratricopeptide (TPR) repeat protein
MIRAALALSITLCSASAVAQSSAAESIPASVRSDLARTHFRTGMRYFDLGRYSDAATEFERVFDYTGQTELLYNIARAHEAAGNAQRAIETYELYLQREPSAPEAIRAHAAALRANTGPTEPTAASAAPTMRCADGSAPSAATGADRPAATEATTASAPSVTAPLPLPLLQLRTRVAYERGALNEVGPWILASAGVIMGGFSAWQALTNRDQVALIESANRGDANGWTINVQDAYDRAPTSRTLAWGLGAVGGTALVGGVVWLLARGRGTRRELVVAALPQPRGGFVTAGGTF